MSNESFTRIHNNRRDFLNKHENKDHVIQNGKNNILISVPHGVYQTRNGIYKFAEIGSLALALELKDKTNSFFIAKTKNNFDDANFDEKSAYKDDLKEIIKNNNIRYVLDFHGMAKKRQWDVNLGTNIGNNINKNEAAFNKLVAILEENAFKVSIDNPFMGSGNTISNFAKREFPNIFSLQVEINCDLTNEIKNSKKLLKLVNCFEEWLNYLNN